MHLSNSTQKNSYMKLFSSLCLLILIGTTSCKKFLDTKPQDILLPSTYYQTEAQLQSALAGVYDIMGEPLAIYKREYLVEWVWKQMKDIINKRLW